MATIEERTAFAKLEALKDIRGKTISLEKVRMRLQHDMDTFDTEDKCLAEYRRELELLQQEKMAHVEELRQIHSDINAMETVIKQAEESKRNAMDSARRLFDDYRPLKHDVDLMRTELLGLDKLPELPNEDKDKMAAIGLLQPTPSMDNKPKYPPPLEQWHHAHAAAAAAAAAHHHQQQQLAAAAAAAVAAGGNADDKGSFASMLAARGVAAAAAGGSHQGGPAPPPPPPPFLAAAAAQHSAMGLGPLAGMGSSKTLQAAQQAGPPAPPPFRQQPPPMKSCLSCHQQIHRNAPICPLCKAKSRSRNPKKPKKRVE